MCVLYPAYAIMAEPLPSQSQSTAQLDADDLPSATTNAEDRKAAAALSSLDARGDDEYDNGKPGGGKGANNNIDQEALGRAISRLEISAGGGGGGRGGGKATEGKDGGDKSGNNKGKGKDVEALKKVKVDQNDVALLVSLNFLCYPRNGGGRDNRADENSFLFSKQVAELELSKTKATELLKTHEGDPVRAMIAYVRASA